MISGKHLYLSVKSAIRTLKGRRREPAAFLVAALCFSGGFALGKLLTDNWITRLQFALYAIGAIAFIYGVVRVWKLVNPPELPPAKNRPSAIKGPMAFTEADGDLFRKLERESELQKLLGLVLDNQILMIVVRGASGAGKTSLLRAGLKHILGERAIFHYWEAVPVEPDKGLLRAVHERWPEGATKPTTLAELVNPSDALGRQSHVIVLDQFEQLRGNKKIFQLLRRIVRESKPPHRITWVIAFRREFSADWLDFISPEQENGIRPPQDISLRLFTTDQAREVIGQLIDESDLKDSIEQSVIDNLVEAATVDGEVSPVDIGIGLLVLTELHERQSSQTITKRDYQFAGGAEGLLTQYINRCLEPFPPESKEAILKAMLALRDPEENRQRLATGLTIDELAAEVGTDTRVLKLQLNRLADRDIRLLEADTPTDASPVRYRLPHERLIPALYRLTGKLLAEVDQAKLKFQNGFQAWHTNDKRSRYLLKGKELRLVQRYETQIPWGKDEQEKKSFLFRSKGHRQLVRAATVAAVLAMIGTGWFSIQQYQRFEHRKYLTESGYPAELYDFQHQLKRLELNEPLNLEHFTWLSSDSIEELSVTAAKSSNSFAGLTTLSSCRSLKKLTLDLSDSQVSDLQPLAQLTGLRQLTLDLSRSQVSDLQPLEQLKGLTQLTLDLSFSQVRELKPLEQLQGLTQLTLYLSSGRVNDLKSVAKLGNLTELTLDKCDGSNLELLTQLSNLTNLTLGLSSFTVRDLEQLARLNKLTRLYLDVTDGKGHIFEPLGQLDKLKQLSLELNPSQMRDLLPLAQLSNLTQFSLGISKSQVSDLKPLGQLGNLTQLSLFLYVETDEVPLAPLASLRNLTDLSINFNSSQITNLMQLGQLSNLTQLLLSLDDNEVGDLSSLEHLKGLTQLTLLISSNKVPDLTSLEQMKQLTQLTLSSKQTINLECLTKLRSLTQLELYLNNLQATDLKVLEQLNGLTQLTIDFGGSQVNNLDSLTKLTNLRDLTVILSTENRPFQVSGDDSLISNVTSISQLNSLQKLSIRDATRAQRMLLRNIPASVVELKF